MTIDSKIKMIECVFRSTVCLGGMVYAANQYNDGDSSGAAFTAIASLMILCYRKHHPNINTTPSNPPNIEIVLGRLRTETSNSHIVNGVVENSNSVVTGEVIESLTNRV